MRQIKFFCVPVLLALLFAGYCSQPAAKPGNDKSEQSIVTAAIAEVNHPLSTADKKDLFTLAEFFS